MAADPRTRELAGELADLIDHFPAERLGRVIRVLVSASDWDARPRHVLVRGGYVKVGSLPQDDSHLVQLCTSERTLLTVLVVPPGFSRDEGDAAMRAVASFDDGCSADALVQQVAGRRRQ